MCTQGQDRGYERRGAHGVVKHKAYVVDVVNADQSSVVCGSSVQTGVPSPSKGHHQIVQNVTVLFALRTLRTEIVTAVLWDAVERVVLTTRVAGTPAMRPPAKSKASAAKNIHLYTDDNPETTIKGMGFRDKATALRTLELVKQKPRARQIWSVNTMLHRSANKNKTTYDTTHAFYRAKHHPHKTPAMEEAIAVFEAWVAEYKAERAAEKNQKGAPKRKNNTPSTAGVCGVHMLVTALSCTKGCSRSGLQRGRPARAAVQALVQVPGRSQW